MDCYSLGNVGGRRSLGEVCTQGPIDRVDLTGLQAAHIAGAGDEVALRSGVVDHDGCVLQELALEAEVPEVKLWGTAREVEVREAGCACSLDECAGAADGVSDVQGLADRTRRSDWRNSVPRTAEVVVHQLRVIAAVVEIEGRTCAGPGSSIGVGR